MVRMRDTLMLMALTAMVTLLLVLGLRAQAQTPSDEADAPASVAAPATSVQADDEQPVDTPQAAAQEKATGSTAGTTVYFTPLDSNDTNTVLFLYNTVNITQTVPIKAFNAAGTRIISQSLTLQPGGMIRVSADSISTTPSLASWAPEVVVVVNFTDTSFYATAELPAGVKIDGYVAWNNSSTYDPRAAVPRLPLRLSVDPANLVYVPALQRPSP
ncbi:MAG TPA: hypothetical protein PKA05_17760 [Roseiflexaceae bacterium]|nr:hypothetical protein [Roseiflexaceae bacterium]HMP42229.1 hypothetical protein [Roseiflexaceae bacterium]